MSRLKNRRTIRISNRAALAAAVLLGIGAAMGVAPQIDEPWSGSGSAAAEAAKTYAPVAAQQAPDKGGSEHRASGKRFTLGQLLFRHR